MLYFVLPAYNEAKDLPELLKAISSACLKSTFEYKVVVVDDGSTDETPQILSESSRTLPLLTFRNEPNQGLGRTLGRGLKEASQLAAHGDVIITMDADNTQDPIYVEALVRAIGQGADIAVASRFVSSGGEQGLSAVRKLLSQGASLFLRVLITRKVRDFSSGYRAYSAEILKRGFEKFGDKLIEEKGFACSPEVLIKLLGLGARVKEVPFVLRYDLKQGESKINVPATVWAYFKMVYRIKFGA